MQNEALLALLVVPLVAYLLLVYSVLPELLYKGEFGSMLRHPGYFFFAGLTSGLGPIIWYWWSVDPVLRRMARAKRRE